MLWWNLESFKNLLAPFWRPSVAFRVLLGPSCGALGISLRSSWGHLARQSAQDAPKTAQRAPKDPKKLPKGFQKISQSSPRWCPKEHRKSKRNQHSNHLIVFKQQCLNALGGPEVSETPPPVGQIGLLWPEASTWKKNHTL